MRQPPAKPLIALLLGTATIAALVWTVVYDTSSARYVVARQALTGWTVAASEGDEPWVLAAQPPAGLSAALVTQLAAGTREPLVAPARAALPLVLRAEFDEALQGVYGIDSLMRVARDVSFEKAVFEPVCVAQRVEGERRLYFIAFNSALFQELREDFRPAQPEHGGIGVYDPASLVPLLPVAASDSDFGRWWPLTFDRRTDCIAPLFVE
jgi:hypothetical protein